MKEIKGIEEINNILNNFLEPFDCTAEEGEDFCYWVSKSCINYAFVVPCEKDKWFQEFIYSLNKKINCDIFLLSFFHELGHHETLDEIEDSILKYCWDIKNELNCKTLITKEDSFMYFNLPDEKAATEWGIRYITTHEKEIKKLWDKLQPAIFKFYKINGIVDFY